MTETAQTCMAMDDFDLFPNNNVSKDREKREDCRHCRLAVDNPKWNVVDFEAIREIMNASPAFVSMRDHDNFVTSINEFLLSCQFACTIGRATQVVLWIADRYGSQLRLGLVSYIEWT